LIVIAFRVKIFGDDAFGKVSIRCKLGASIVNFLMERNSIFSHLVAVKGMCLFVLGH
jgi:hypothetical protein